MTIDGTNISTFGLRLLALDGYYSKPARKRIFTEPIHTDISIKFENKECTLTLFGEYATLALMYSNIESFKTAIKTDLIHTWVLVGHEETFTGVVADGFETEVINKTVQLRLKINITE